MEYFIHVQLNMAVTLSVMVLLTMARQAGGWLPSNNDFVKLPEASQYLGWKTQMMQKRPQGDGIGAFKYRSRMREHNTQNPRMKPHQASFHYLGWTIIGLDTAIAKERTTSRSGREANVPSDTTTHEQA